MGKASVVSQTCLFYKLYVPNSNDFALFTDFDFCQTTGQEIGDKSVFNIFEDFVLRRFILLYILENSAIPLECVRESMHIYIHE